MKQTLFVLIIRSFLLLPSVRKSAVNPESVLSLIEHLSSGNSNSQMTSAAKLEARAESDPDVIPALINALDHKKRIVRYYAASVLGRIGSNAEAAIPALAKMLGNTREENADRAMAANALGLIGPAALPALSNALSARDAYIRRCAASALTRMAGKTPLAVPLLINALGDNDEDVRGEVRAALTFFFAAEAVPALRSAQKNPNLLIRVEVAHCLVTLDSSAEGAIGTLVDLLQHKDNEIRTSAAWGLHKAGLHAKKAIPKLTNALSDDDYRVRWGAAAALAEMGREGRQAIPALIKTLGDKSKDVQETVMMALTKMRPVGKHSIEGLLVAAQNGNIQGRVFALHLLGEIGSDAKNCVPILNLAAGSDEPVIAKAAKEALERIQGKKPKQK